MPDPDIEQLSNAGLSVFDLNSEYLGRKDWSDTPLGPPADWPQSLTSYVSLIKALPHPAAVFWGAELSILHNFAWGQATKYHDGQGRPAVEKYRGEARSSLQSAVTGRTVRIAGDLFSENTPGGTFNASVIICPLLNERGHRQGAFAQSLDDPLSQRSLDHELLGGGSVVESHGDKHRSQNEEFLDKSQEDQDEILSNAVPPVPSDMSDAVSRHGRIDLKQSQLFQRFAELLPTGLAILNHNAEAVFVNDQFFSLTTKKTSREFRSWPESIDPRDYERVMSEYREAFKERRDVKVDFRCVSGDEGERNDPDQPENDEWRMFLLRPLNSTKTSGYICAVVDITELKTAELAQERTARDAKDRKQQQERFIDMVSHEIRNPLSAVLHLAEEIKETSKDMERNVNQPGQIAEIIDCADTILICVSHQSVLVDDILNFSKLDSAMMSLAPSVSQPKWVLSKQLKVFQAELKTNHIGFEYAMDASFSEVGVDWVVADLSRIKQVLVNLMTNAIKFTSRMKGRRTIKVTMAASDERPISYPANVVFFNDYKEEGDQTRGPEWGDGPPLYLMVAVTDTGIGISTQDQERLFERFRQATPKTSEKYGGSGLGLSISRKLCQLHGGDIGVGSNEGHGSTFGFYFKARHALPHQDGSGTASGRRTPMRQRSSESIPSRPRLQSRQQSSSQKPGVDRIDESALGEDMDEVQGGDATNRNNIADRPGLSRDTETNPTLIEPVQLATSVNSDSAKEGRSPALRSADREMAQSNQEDDRGSGTSVNPNVSSDKQEGGSGGQGQVQRTLLLVEDNLINQKVLKRQLQNHGFEVCTANNGQEAIDAVVSRAKRKHDNASEAQPQDSSDHFACILMDQEMPVKDGNTAAREIRDLQLKGEVGRSPILGVSANVREEQTRVMKEAGMDEVISKPFKVKDLVKRIDALAETIAGNST
ncbi:hypothetical protein DHEL01_v208212 [Diaporthe helianthi]|uniref:Hsp90-like protein n=1 Tax=Diaporthe helianthi TaxID=158607 RepID=A0A2P5HT04_DIAHE|nr:hypothetical protein DHEL01_v208212 [Diaporthe helianthi]